jgi:hypothetical protein
MKRKILVECIPLVAVMAVPVGEAIAGCWTTQERDCVYTTTTYDYGSSISQDVTSTCGPWQSKTTCDGDSIPPGGGGSPPPTCTYVESEGGDDGTVLAGCGDPPPPPRADCHGCGEGCLHDASYAEKECLARGAATAANRCARAEYIDGGNGSKTGSFKWECSDHICVKFDWYVVAEDPKKCVPTPWINCDLHKYEVQCKEAVRTPDGATLCRHVGIPGDPRCFDEYMAGKQGAVAGAGGTVTVPFKPWGEMSVNAYREWNVNPETGINRTCRHISLNVDSKCREAVQCPAGC